jgi:N-acetylglutamate synthase-like GNAT family acetyltransferase
MPLDGTTCQISCAKTDRPKSVRIATAVDEAALFDLVLEAHDDNGIFGKSEAKLREWASNFAKNDGLRVAGVIDGADGRIVGCVALVLSQPWYSDQWVIEDRLVYVRRDCRRTHHARDLVLFAKSYSEALGVPLVISVLPKERWQDKSKFFSRYLKQAGTAFLHDGRK